MNVGAENASVPADPVVPPEELELEEPLELEELEPLELDEPDDEDPELDELELLQPPRPTNIAPAGPTSSSTNQPRYRALPPQDQPKVHLSTTRKRKHASKSHGSRPVYYFEGSDSESEDFGRKSGDGSSSGDSIPSDTPTNVKCQKTSAIITRSSTQTPAPDVNDGEPSESTPLPPAVLAPLPMVTTGTRTNTSKSASGTTTAMPPAVNPSRANDLRRTESAALTLIDADPAPANTAPDNSAPDNTESDPMPAGPPPLPPLIRAGDVPAFLRHHGRGKRVVDIFSYLDKVEDPHFRWILFHYIQFEANDKSGAGGTLPTAGRPAEIVWWTSRACPSDIPNLPDGSRAFKTFTDSVLRWWGSIQPSWRTFEQGKASRDIKGSWESLYAPRINGILNVVILAYWWVSILNNDKPEDGVREDYEFFADDVAWVLSKLLTA